MRFVWLFYVLFHLSFHSFGQIDWKQKIKFAFGKEKHWQEVKTLQYHLKVLDSEGNLLREADYVLDFINQSIQETKTIGKDIVQNILTKNQKISLINGIQTDLNEKDAKRLATTLYYNFFNFFIRENIAFEYIAEGEYKGEKASIIRVKDLNQQEADLDIWVSTQSYLILTSSTPINGTYSYYADELDYQKIYKSLQFPLTFQIYEANKIINYGVFTACKVN